ncbi:MAG: DUF1294 domain-containing protein [Thermoplasmatota archaeon]
MARKRHGINDRNAWLVHSLASFLLHGSLFIPLIIFTGIHPYLAWLISAGLTAFMLMGWDKIASKAEKLRTPEKLFFLVFVLGGFIGGTLGMVLFRHKTSKIPFKIALALSLAVHIVIGVLLFG